MTVLLFQMIGDGDEAKDASANEHHGFAGPTWEELDDAPFITVSGRPGVSKLSTF